MVEPRQLRHLILMRHVVFLYLSEVSPGHVGPKKFGLNSFLHAFYDRLFMEEVHLVFGGMHIDVNILRGDLKTETQPDILRGDFKTDNSLRGDLKTETQPDNILRGGLKTETQPDILRGDFKTDNILRGDLKTETARQHSEG